ncbi:na(+)/H(+) antiporter [[Candida] anglica]
MVWSQLELEKAHIAYACVGIFSTIFSLVSLFVKEKLYIGEATVATIAGLILGPHCLDWFNPVSWGNTDHITLEISRIVLCIQIVAVAVELPRKYMKKHWVSVAILLLPVMTCGWLIVGLFIWVLIPHFDFPSALLVSACVTATDPVLAAAVVGKGKFAERVPGHLRNLLSAESGCNDGMAFPFIFLSLNLIIHPHNGGEVVKDWILITILYECIFGCILGVALGFLLKRAVAFAESKKLIDRESFLAIFVFLAFNSAGIGSMLGVDDLLVSFAAGTAFGWNGDFAKKTEESHVSTVIDLLLNLSFFVYFGAIIPWPQFNNAELGLNCWRLIILAIVIIFLRRMPAVLALKVVTPDIKSWREALFCGHFGPIGVGAIFAAILARKDLEAHYSTEETPLAHLPSEDFPHYQLLATIWPIVCFIILTSIIVHGSSVAVLTLGKRLNRMAITMSFTTTNTKDQGSSWMSRLQKLDKASTSFSLHRIDTMQVPEEDEKKAAQQQEERLAHANTIETSGIKVRPAGGAKRRKHKKKKKRSTPGDRLKKTLSRVTSRDDENGAVDENNGRRDRPQTEFLQLGRTVSQAVVRDDEDEEGQDTLGNNATIVNKEDSTGGSEFSSGSSNGEKREELQLPPPDLLHIKDDQVPTTAFKEGDKVIIEDQHGEVLDTVSMSEMKKSKKKDRDDDMSIHSMESLRRKLTQYSEESEESDDDDGAYNEDLSPTNTRSRRRRSISPSRLKGKKAFYKKDDPKHRKVFAHQIDNMIVIENADGEIIRRYKVSKHPSVSGATSAGGPGTRVRSSSIVGKALSLVGIKGGAGTSSANNDSVNAVTSAGSSQASGGKVPVLIKTQDSKDPKSPLRDSDLESRLEKKITTILSGRSDDPRQRNPSIVVEHPADISEEDSEEVNSDISEDSEEEDEDEDEDLRETEVEKRRRLAALGQIRGQRRDDDDEEEV